MDELDIDLDVFRSNVCHRVKDMGELGFIVAILQSEMIFQYWYVNKRFQALYVLAMIDYLCRINDIPVCQNYDELRYFCFKEPLYPKDVLLLSKLLLDRNVKEETRSCAIPEFMRFNIVECDIDCA